MAWELTARGKLYHSGMPDRSINPVEFIMDAVSYIQERFYAKYPPHPDEKRYKFATPSTLKPTQVAYPQGSVNQIPGECTVGGDVRTTPFYSVEVGGGGEGWGGEALRGGVALAGAVAWMASAATCVGRSFMLGGI